MNFFKKTGISFLTLVVLLTAVLLVKAQQNGENAIKEFETKHPNGIVVFAKILNIDAQKGDISIRLEFAPDGDLIKEDGTLTKTLKLDTESANGKTEVTFEKGKRMNASEVVLNMYGIETSKGVFSKVEDYPFDKHNADLYVYIYTKPEKKKEAAKDAAPKEGADAEKKEGEAEVNEETEEEIPLLLVFEPSMSGYSITSEKAKDNEDTYVHQVLKISRSSTVVGFASFIMLLMWGVTLAVVGLVLTVVIGGRKSELAMFSFIATLIFSFITLRNAMPGTPPVGTYSDNLSFFWVEGILGVCLLAVVLTWVFRKS